jgi:hypothetical protein
MSTMTTPSIVSFLILSIALAGCGGGGSDSATPPSSGATHMVAFFPGTTMVSAEGDLIDGRKSGLWACYNNPDGSLPETPSQFASLHYKRWDKFYVNGSVTEWTEFNGEADDPSVRLTSTDK